MSTLAWEGVGGCRYVGMWVEENGDGRREKIGQRGKGEGRKGGGGGGGLGRGGELGWEDVRIITRVYKPGWLWWVDKGEHTRWLWWVETDRIVCFPLYFLGLLSPLPGHFLFLVTLQECLQGLQKKW